MRQRLATMGFGDAKEHYPDIGLEELARSQKPFFDLMGSVVRRLRRTIGTLES